MNIFWFRRDLRLDDNAGLYHALKSGNPVQCVFIFDNEILDKLEDKKDRRVVFIHRQLSKLNQQLTELGSSLIVKHGKPIEAWKKLVNEFKISFYQSRLQPYAEHDETIRSLLRCALPCI